MVGLRFEELAWLAGGPCMPRGRSVYRSRDRLVPLFGGSRPRIADDRAVGAALGGTERTDLRFGLRSVARKYDVDQQAGVVSGAPHVDDGVRSHLDARAHHHALKTVVVRALVAAGQARLRAG